MSNMESEKEGNLFASGTIWFISCVLVTTLPILLSCIFRFVSENEKLTVSLFISKYLWVHLKDILLIIFSISCSLLALCIDKSKSNIKILKKMGIIISCTAAIFSGCYYYYIDGKDSLDVENRNLILFFYITLFVICSILGWIIGNKHDKQKQPDKTFSEEEN